MDTTPETPEGCAPPPPAHELVRVPFSDCVNGVEYSLEFEVEAKDEAAFREALRLIWSIRLLSVKLGD